MALQTVISIEPENNLIRFMSAQGTDKNSINVVEREYKAPQFSDKFFEVFTSILQEYSQANIPATGKAAPVTIILPDGKVLTDSISTPTVKKKMMEELINVAIEAKYKNLADLKYNRFTVGQNNAYVTYGISALRVKLIQAIYTACSASNMFASTITFDGSATVNGALAVNPKLKAETFVYADIKENSTKLCYVVNGMCIGSYGLQFGHSILTSDKVIAENMLFNHQVAELAVLNAKEKAKAKQMTVMDAAPSDDEEDSTSIFAGGFDQQNTEAGPTTIKVLPKKQPRSLPKFMQRPEPQNPEETAYENYRYFEKYILEFIKCNKRLTAIAKPNYVLMNLPAEYSYLVDKTNESETENGVKFQLLDVSREGTFVPENMDLYGALFVDQFNTVNNF